MKSKLPKKKPKRTISDREMEVLTRIANGMAKKEIADQLDISESTIVYHTKHIYEKLEAINAPSAIHKAYQTGILSAGDQEK